jgi:hypothetical protein
MKRRQVFRAQASKSQSSSSVRRFTNSGPVLPFNPASIPGCQLWLDAADTSSVALNSSANVLAWIDKSGNGNHMNTIAGSSSTYWSGTPAYPTIGTSINGLQTVKFVAQSGLKQATTLDGVKNLFWVGRIAAPDGSGSAPNYFLLGHDSVYDWSANQYGDKFLYPPIVPSGINNASASLFTSDSNAVTNTAFQNVYLPSAPNVSLLSVSGITGTTRYQGICYDRDIHIGWCGDLAEVIIFNSALTTIQRQKVEGYLANKWGLQTSLPSNHPHKTAAPTYEEPVFVPTLISGNKIWFDAFDASYTTSGTTVTAWTNKTGNSNASTGIGTVNINQATLNGKSSVRFPVGTNYLTVGAQTYSTSYRNVFFVVTVGAIGSKYFYLNCDDVICGQCYSWDSDIEINRAGSNGLVTNNPSGFFSSTNVVSICTSSGGNTGIWVNGVSQTLAVNNVGTGSFWSTGTTSVAIRLGGEAGTTTGTLDMYELLQYDGSLTPSQRRRVEGYLAQKWGLHSSLPANHPYKTIAPTGIPRSITIQSLSAFFSDVNIQSLSIPSNAALNLGTNNHTIEFWFYQTSRGQYDTIFTYGSSPPEWTSRSNYFINIGTTQFSAFIGDGSGGFLAVDGGALITLNTWHHFALVRNGSMFTLYINGASRGTLTSSISIGPQIGSMTFGTWGLNGADRFRGYITNFRVVNGTAVYTSNFTPPTSPLTAIPNTQVLIQGLVDRSPNAFTVTSTGSVTLSTSVSPFV